VRCWLEERTVSQRPVGPAVYLPATKATPPAVVRSLDSDLTERALAFRSPKATDMAVGGSNLISRLSVLAVGGRTLWLAGALASGVEEGLGLDPRSE
jgi:hypothetical protein